MSNSITSTAPNSSSSYDDTDVQSSELISALPIIGRGEEYKGEYPLDSFRDIEYPQLCNGKVYLDHGGTTLYAKSLVEEFSADMVDNLYGNPHSSATPSRLAGHRVDAIRDRALRFFNADPAEWDLVFTANATAAIKLVNECFHDFAELTNTSTWYGYHRDSHSSVVGGRELSRYSRCFQSDQQVTQWIDKSCPLSGSKTRVGLFAYPGQSNMTGRRLPTIWPHQIRRSHGRHVTYSLLDAAALATTTSLDLHDSLQAPDFVALSFYKIFGFPNIGALLVQKRSQHVLLHRKYFGGGTVDMVISINGKWHAKKDSSLHDRLEEGTLPFHSIFALDHAMNVHERLYGPEPMKRISRHTASLSRELYKQLADLSHHSKRPLIRIYKDANAVYGDPIVQGATIAFNVLNEDGSVVAYDSVEAAADKVGIYVRSGSLCNPGGTATYLDWSPQEMIAAYNHGHRCSTPMQTYQGKPTGVVRASLGAMSTQSDIDRLVEFLRTTYTDRPIGNTDSISGHRILNIPLSAIQEQPRVASYQKPNFSMHWESKKETGSNTTETSSAASIKGNRWFCWPTLCLGR